ncbi:MAG: serine hydrolase [Pseudomonadales bacterium]|nr:serine hydrolase [Pseudomonadales bacterium]
MTHALRLRKSLGLLAVSVFACSVMAASDTSETDTPTPGSLLFASQDERDLAFREISDGYPVREITAGENVFPLHDAPRDFSSLTYMLDGKEYGFSDFLNMRESRGLLVWQDGDVLLEYYTEGHDRNTRWVSFSVSKSVTSMLIGAAIKDGYIQSVDEPVTNYVSRFRGTAYADTTIKNVLQMASGVTWNEDYADTNSDVAHAGSANGIALVKYLANLSREEPAGTKFNYNTGETNLVGEILRAAIGNNATTYLVHKIWQPFGMESDATWLLGSVAGGETGGCCISATLRDYARIGIFAMSDGVLPDGSKVLPDGWMAESTTPSEGFVGYGYLWWLDETGSYRARGIFGQQIFVDNKSKVVIAAHSNAPTAVGSDYHLHLEEVVRALHAEVSQ